MSTQSPESAALEEGREHFNKGRWAPALACFGRVPRGAAQAGQAACFAAHALFCLGKESRAIGRLRRLIRAEPRHPRGYLSLAGFLRAQGRFGAAERLLARVLALFPGHSPAREAMRQVLRDWAMKRQAEDRMAQAEGLWERYLELAPGDFRARREMAEVRRRRKGEPRDAPLPRRARKAAPPPRPPESSDYFRTLARAGRYRRAIREGERILDRGATLQDLRTLWHPWKPEELERISKAHVKSLTRLSREMPRSPWPPYFLSLLSHQETAGLERMAGKLGRRYGWMGFKVGHLLLLNDHFVRASRWLRRALRHEVKDWRVHGFLAEAYLCLGQRRKAFQEIRRGREAAPREEKAQAVAWEGAFELWLGRYRRALRLLDTACAGGARWAYCWRGGAKIKLGRPGEALRDLDKAVRLYPGDREAFVWRGEAKRLLGRDGGALRDLSRPPLSRWALMNRGLVYARLKKYNRMEADYRAISRAVVAYIKRRAGLDSGRPESRRDMRTVFRTGLALSRGYRHNNPYADALWMV